MATNFGLLIEDSGHQTSTTKHPEAICQLLVTLYGDKVCITVSFSLYHILINEATQAIV